MKLKPYQLPLLIIVAGVLFTFYLQWLIPDGVYFSGDAGLKALLAKQLSTGLLRFDLVSPSETWVRELWEQGLYPYEEPFVYRVSERYYITFPFTFPLITAPFDQLFGSRGLYFIPLVSTWIIWLVTYAVCCRLKFSSFHTSLALVILIFGSPLTLYSAIYWEHTLSIALAISGLFIFLFPNNASNLYVKNAAFSGFLIGLSVWFRPEFLGLVAFLIGLVYLASVAKVSQFETITRRFQLQSIVALTKNKEVFVLSLLTTISLFFLLNKLIYNHPLGIHAIQVVEKTSLLQRLKDAFNSFKGLSFTFLNYFPIAFFSLIYLGLALFKIKTVKFNLKIAILYLGSLLFIFWVSLIVPAGTAGLIAGGKQWGARFLLLLIPIFTLLTVQELIYLQKTTKPICKYTVTFIIYILLILSIHKNIHLGTLYLQENYQGILPAIKLLQSSPTRVVAISHQFVGQALEPSLTQDKLFFKIEDSKKVVQLGRTLLTQKQSKFMYICYPFRSCPLTEEKSENLQFEQDNQSFEIKLFKLGDFGKYPIYEATIKKI